LDAEFDTIIPAGVSLCQGLWFPEEEFKVPSGRAKATKGSLKVISKKAKSRNPL
jgi:hypothetical protein